MRTRGLTRDLLTTFTSKVHQFAEMRLATDEVKSFIKEMNSEQSQYAARMLKQQYNDGLDTISSREPKSPLTARLLSHVPSMSYKFFRDLPVREPPTDSWLTSTTDTVVLPAIPEILETTETTETSETPGGVQEDELGSRWGGKTGCV